MPILHEAGWAQGLVWTGTKILASKDFEPQTVQQVTSRYTDCAIPAAEISECDPWLEHGPFPPHAFDMLLPDHAIIQRYVTGTNDIVTKYNMTK
jgi:hypothetical protein